MNNIRQLWAMLSSDLHEHLHATRTLVVGGWDWIFQAIQARKTLSSHLLVILYIPQYPDKILLVAALGIQRAQHPSRRVSWLSRSRR